MQYDPKEFKKYPDVMSKEQLYKVCHIAKRTATYLLQSGLIPNTYTGRRTRCYQIKKKDVIAFLEDREVNPNKYILPKKFNEQNAFRIRILPGEDFSRERLRAFYENELKTERDVLTVADIVRITGYCRTTVSSWVRKEKLNGFLIGRNLRIPKTYLIDFLSDGWYNSLSRKTKKHVTALWRIAGK